MISDSDRGLLLAAFKVGVAIVDAVRVAGPLGAPAGVLYAALSAHGCSLAQFDCIMAGFVTAEVLVHDGHSYMLGRRAGELGGGRIA